MRPALLPLALLLALPSVARGQAPARGDELRVNWAVDGVVVGVSGLAWIASELFKGEFAPESCRWCATNSLDTGVSNGLAWGDLKAGSTTGDVTAFGVIPVLTLGGGLLAAGLEDRLSETPANALLVVEAVTLSSLLNQAVKFAAGRERPFVADLPAEEKGRTAKPDDNNLSFYSGHSNLAFAMVVSAGTVAQLRGYKAAPYIWAVGLPLATFVAYSRIAAKKHYLSDVVVGSALGAAVGFLVPFLHRTRPTVSGQGASLTLSPAPNGLVLGGTFY